MESVAVFSTASDIFVWSDGIFFSASPTTDSVGLSSGKTIFWAWTVGAVALMKTAIINNMNEKIVIFF